MAYDLRNVKVLIVDDNKPMLSLLKAMLTKFGVGYILTAADGEEGFKVYRKERPDLIISDWQMEPKDGVYLAKKVRSSPDSPDPYVPFILMTGFNEEHRVCAARDVGITEFLLKPFSAEDLYKRFVTVIEAPRQFVKSKDFFGPDRRRHDSSGYTGKRKRRDDPVTQGDLEKAEKLLKGVVKEQGVSSSQEIMFDESVVDIDLIDRKKDE